jgi:hypothetical protein
LVLDDADRRAGAKEGSKGFGTDLSLMLGVNEIGVEHWVGGILEFARLWNE